MSSSVGCAERTRLRQHARLWLREVMQITNQAPIHTCTNSWSRTLFGGLDKIALGSVQGRGWGGGGGEGEVVKEQLFLTLCVFSDISSVFA